MIWPFTKAKHHSSKGATAKWESVLTKSDLAMARDQIADTHTWANAKATKEGGEYFFAKEYVAAWEIFRDDPSVQTASELLDVAPPLIRVFEKCSPGNDFYETHRLLKDRGLLK